MNPADDYNKRLITSLLFSNRHPHPPNVVDSAETASIDALNGANNELADEETVGPKEYLDEDNIITYNTSSVNVNDYNFPDEHKNSFRLTYQVQITM